MRARWPITVSLLVTLAASAPAYAQPSATSPPPPPSTDPAGGEVWYGWQTLIVGGISGAAAVVAIGLGEDGSGVVLGAPVGLGGFVFGGPIVHWAHGRVGRGFAVLGMNVGVAGVGAALFGF